MGYQPHAKSPYARTMNTASLFAKKAKTENTFTDLSADKVKKSSQLLLKKRFQKEPLSACTLWATRNLVLRRSASISIVG